MYGVNIVIAANVIIASTHSCQYTHTQTQIVTLSTTQKHHSWLHTHTHILQHWFDLWPSSDLGGMIEDMGWGTADVKVVSWVHLHWIIALIEHVIISGAVSESRIIDSQELLKVLLVWHYCTSMCIQSSELITVCDAWLPSYRNCCSIWCVMGWVL